jgi:hypothetical protein
MQHQDPKHGYPGILAGYRPVALGRLAVPALINRIRGYRPPDSVGGAASGLLGYDGVTSSLVPQGGKWYGYYFDGIYANGSDVKADHPDASWYVSITPDGANGAMCGDTEAGCMSVSQDPGFYRNPDHGTPEDIGGVAVKPWIYCSAANLTAVQNEMTSAGIPRDDYFLWSAHYTGVPHYCGPTTCGYGLSAADACQYATSADYDSDIAQPYVFEPAVPSILPAPTGLSSTPTASYVDLGWIRVASATSYHYQVGDLRDATLISESTPDTNVQLKGLAAGSSFRWRVSSEHPSGNWSAWKAFTTPQEFYGPPSLTDVRVGHTNVFLEWKAPAPLNGVAAAEYLVYIYRGTDCSTHTLVASYPRSASGTFSSFGSLSERTQYTVHVVAGGKNMSSVAPDVFASATFTTGG